jgi:hypothetical protein
MNAPRTRLAIRCLHWTVGVVVLIESIQTFYFAHSAHGTSHAGTLIAWRLVLSACEIVAALLFLIPASSVAGALLLLVILGLAFAIHALHGEFRGLEILVLYGVAIYVSWAETRESRAAELTGTSQID